MKSKTKEKLLYAVCPYCEKRGIKRWQKLGASRYGKSVKCMICDSVAVVQIFGIYFFGGIFGMLIILLITSIFPDNKMMLLLGIIITLIFCQLYTWVAPLDTKDRKKE